VAQLSVYRGPGGRAQITAVRRWASEVRVGKKDGLWWFDGCDEGNWKLELLEEGSPTL
jgi:hypothetical protein